MVVAALGWYLESLGVSAECEDKREVDGRSTDERGSRDGGTQTKDKVI
jgi:hypothetical protein